MPTRRHTLLGLSAAAGSLALAPRPSRAAPEVTLKVHHFLGPKAPTQADFIAPWAKRVEAQSEGRIKIEIYPSMSLGGTPPQLIRQVRQGVVDIVWTLPGYTAGQFPRVEVFEIPFVHTNNPVATNLAIQDLYAQWLAPEFQDVHPILIHVHKGQVIHTVDTPVRKFADAKGLKLRIPTRVGGWYLDAIGASPVGMPVPEIPQALSRKVIDGALIPFEVALPLKVTELVKYHTIGPDDMRFGTGVFLFAMNKQRYESLPDDLRAVIDANSGKAIAKQVGEIWIRAEGPGREAAIKHGNEIIVVSAAEMKKFRAAADPVAKRWTEEVSSHGIDGKDLLIAAREAVAKHSAA